MCLDIEPYRQSERANISTDQITHMGWWWWGGGGGSWSVSIAYQATPPGSRCYAGRFLGAPTGFPPSLPGATSSRRSSVEDQTRKGLLNIL